VHIIISLNKNTYVRFCLFEDNENVLFLLLKVGGYNELENETFDSSRRAEENFCSDSGTIVKYPSYINRLPCSAICIVDPSNPLILPAKSSNLRKSSDSFFCLSKYRNTTSISCKKVFMFSKSPSMGDKHSAKDLKNSGYFITRCIGVSKYAERGKFLHSDHKDRRYFFFKFVNKIDSSSYINLLTDINDPNSSCCLILSIIILFAFSKFEK
jgi:hypothetical protein